jgi:radical SAM superfamily enzyme YgiQ (UPF0313 family)
MNVLLIEINPFSPASIPISIGYIGTFLKTKGFNVKILNIGEDTCLSKADLYNIILEFRPGLVGFSTYQRNLLYVLAISRFIKEVDKNIKIVLGGPQTTFMPTDALRYMPVEYICRGEGEFTILSVAQAVEGGTPFSNIRGVSYKADGKIFDSEPSELYEKLDLYPSPHLAGIFDYRNVKEAILLTSRGCPYNCIFCYTPSACRHKIRFHSIERVIEEIKWLVKNGVNRLWFADPIFSFDISRVHSLLDKIIENDIISVKFPYESFPPALVKRCKEIFPRVLADIDASIKYQNWMDKRKTAVEGVIINKTKTKIEVDLGHQVGILDRAEWVPKEVGGYRNGLLMFFMFPG